MAWTWTYQGPEGETVSNPEDAPEQPAFPTQADAETWIGEVWRDLRESGVHGVTLYEDDHKSYGPMSLDPA